MPPQATPIDVVQAKIMSGLVAAVAERGYAAVTINDIVRSAQVSKSTFYAQYDDKEACFLATYQLAADHVLDVIVEASRRDLGNAERVLAATEAYLERIAGDPATARVFILEVLAAGPAALAMRHAVNARFAEVLRELIAERQDARIGELTPAAALLVVGGANELVLSAIVEDRLDQLPSYAPTVAAAVLAAAGAGPRPDDGGEGDEPSGDSDGGATGR